MSAQVHEELILNGEWTAMACTPDLPEHHVRIVETPHWQPEREEDAVILSTACWRQYIGTWEIRDERMYLRGLRGRLVLVGDEPLFADWFSGTLRIPGGEVLPSVQMGVVSVCEKELLLSIERGVIRSTENVDHRPVDDEEDRMIWEELEMGMGEWEDDD